MTTRRRFSWPPGPRSPAHMAPRLRRLVAHVARIEQRRADGRLSDAEALAAEQATVRRWATRLLREADAAGVGTPILAALAIDRGWVPETDDDRWAVLAMGLAGLVAATFGAIQAAHDGRPAAEWQQEIAAAILVAAYLLTGHAVPQPGQLLWPPLLPAHMARLREAGMLDDSDRLAPRTGSKADDGP